MQQELSYGIVYGFLLALMAYNAILFASLRSSRYLLYALYLAMFVAMNVAYTGHGFAWLWPDSVRWQQWSNPVLMVLYGASGLMFAIRFLDLQVYFPRVRKAVIGFCATFGTLLAAAILLGNQKVALLAAFSFAFLFSIVMLALGVISVRAGQKPAKYFLIAALTAMVGALLTTLAVHHPAQRLDLPCGGDRHAVRCHAACPGAGLPAAHGSGRKNSCRAAGATGPAHGLEQPARLLRQDRSVVEPCDSPRAPHVGHAARH